MGSIRLPMSVVVSFLLLLPLPSLRLSTGVCLGYEVEHTSTDGLFKTSLHAHYRNFFTTVASADFSQFVVTTVNGTACEISRLRCVLFSSIYLPHLLILPATFGFQRLFPPYPYFRASYVVPVRQVSGLPIVSFRFHFTADLA